MNKFHQVDLKQGIYFDTLGHESPTILQGHVLQVVSQEIMCKYLYDTTLVLWSMILMLSNIFHMTIELSHKKLYTINDGIFFL